MDRGQRHREHAVFGDGNEGPRRRQQVSGEDAQRRQHRAREHQPSAARAEEAFRDGRERRPALLADGRPEHALADELDRAVERDQERRAAEQAARHGPRRVPDLPARRHRALRAGEREEQHERRLADLAERGPGVPPEVRDGHGQCAGADDEQQGQEFADRRRDRQPGAPAHAGDVDRRQCGVDRNERPGPSRALPGRRYDLCDGIDQDRANRRIGGGTEAQREHRPRHEPGHRPEAVFDIRHRAAGPRHARAKFRKARQDERDGEAAHQIREDRGGPENRRHRRRQREDPGAHREVDGVGPQGPRPDGPGQAIISVHAQRRFYTHSGPQALTLALFVHPGCPSPVRPHAGPDDPGNKFRATRVLYNNWTLSVQY